MNNLFGAFGENISGVLSTNLWIGVYTPTPQLLQNAAGQLNLLNLDRVTQATFTVKRLGAGTLTPATTVDAAGTVRATGQDTPTSGAGVEIYYGAPNGVIQCFDHGVPSFKNLDIEGLTLQFNTSTNGAISTGTGLVTFGGTITAPHAVIGAVNTPNAPLSFGTFLGDKIYLYDNGASSGYGLGIQSGVLQIFGINSSAAVQLGYGVSASFTSVFQVLSPQSGTKAGTSTQYSKIGGTIFDDIADVGNVTTTETDIFTHSVLANTWNTNGDAVQCWWEGTTANNANGKTFKFYVAGTAVATITPPAAQNVGWVYQFTIVRDSATTVRWSILGICGGASSGVTGKLTGLTLSNANIVKLTGTATATNDIVGQAGKMFWKSAA